MLTQFCKLTGTSPADILGRSRKREIVDARHLYWLLLRNSGLTYQAIARMSGKHHATVINGVRRMNGYIECGDEWMVGMLDKVKEIKRF